MKAIERRDETVLEAILRVTGRSGGTIHQYLDVCSVQYDMMKKSFLQLKSIGIEFPSKSSLQKLASQYNCDINWNGDRS